MKTILIVCSMNMCRSPMAEALLRRHVIARGRDWRVHSAGTVAVDGFSAVENAVAAMAKLGLDISTHVSRSVCPELIEDASVVLVMSQCHATEIGVDLARRPSRIFLFNEMAGTTTDVDDPIGGTLDDFVECASRLDSTIRLGFDWLIDRAE